MSVLWNGQNLDWFTPTRGLRQGDAISPYLFVLCMECLSHLIDKAVQDGRYAPIKVARTIPPLSHLFFADDLLLFSEASEKQIRVIMECLNQFCLASSQKVNLQKSYIALFKDVEESTAFRILETAGTPSPETWRTTRELRPSSNTPIRGCSSMYLRSWIAGWKAGSHDYYPWQEEKPLPSQC